MYVFIVCSVNDIVMKEPSLLRSHLHLPSPANISCSPMIMTFIRNILTRHDTTIDTHARHIPTSPFSRCLISLPHSFDTLCTETREMKCKSCNSYPDHPALCLLCGMLLCAGNECCRHVGEGECTQHVRHCGNGNGIVLLMRQTNTLLLRGKYAASYISPYVDEYGNIYIYTSLYVYVRTYNLLYMIGEEDVSLRRGRPLFLSKERYEALQKLVQRNTINSDVTRIRISSDKVYRQGFY